AKTSPHRPGRARPRGGAPPHLCPVTSSALPSWRFPFAEAAALPAPAPAPPRHGTVTFFPRRVTPTNAEAAASNSPAERRTDNAALGQRRVSPCPPPR